MKNPCSWEPLRVFQLSFISALSAIYYDSNIFCYLGLAVLPFISSLSQFHFCVPSTSCLLQ